MSEDNKIQLYVFDENTPSEDFRVLFYPEEFDLERFKKSMESKIITIPEDILSIDNIRRFIIEASKED